MKKHADSCLLLQRLPALALAALLGLVGPLLRANAPEAPAPFPSPEPDGLSADSALPALVERVEPARPAALSAGTEARVFVAFVVDAQGRVVDPRVMFACPPACEEAALAAVAQWKFTAGRHHGRAVSTRMTVALQFAAPRS